MPETVDEWVDRLAELMEEVEASTVSSALGGNAAAKATIQGWAAEMEAAAIFIAAYTGTAQAQTDLLIETANTIIDTVQAILLALGIIWILRKLRKRERGDGIVEIQITERKARVDLGDKTNPIPSRPDQDREKEAAFLFLRLSWATHFMLTLMQGLQIQAEGSSTKELKWVAKLDANTCSICRFMHGKTSEDGDFLPVILKQFPKYSVYVNWMPWPHAHPRCRCSAVPS